MTTDTTTDLYRYFDAEGRLLYVGISFSAVARASQHRSEKGWWPDVATMTVERHDTRAEALAAEAIAIRTEKPLHNVIGNTAPLAPARIAPQTETGNAVYHAVLRLMSSSETPSPWTLQDIIAAIERGVHDAVAEHLEAHGLVAA
jgi:predicted GIY-YIG superfamily endonuclease